MMYMSIETFYVSVIAQNATMVDYVILFGGMHPTQRYIIYDFRSVVFAAAVRAVRDKFVHHWVLQKSASRRQKVIWLCG